MIILLQSINHFTHKTPPRKNKPEKMIDDHKQIIEQRFCKTIVQFVCFKVSKGVQLTNDIVANGSILSIFGQLCGRLTRVRCSLICIVIRCLFVCLGR